MNKKPTFDFEQNNKADTSISPQISKLPAYCSKRLIDSGILHFEASNAGFSERYRKGETSHTVHVWWARRPHSTMRALVFSSVCKDNSASAAELLSRITSGKIDDNLLKIAKQYVRKNYKETPKLLDMFGGGGTIPFESKALGINTYSIDINELSVFIQKCNLIYSKYINNTNINKIIRTSGEKILTGLKNKTDWLFPLRKKYNDSMFGYLWSYSINCPDCFYKIFLIKRPWLTKKNGKKLAFKAVNCKKSQIIVIGDANDNHDFTSVWQKRSGDIKCPNCKKIINDINIKSCKDELLALIKTTPKSGKCFIPVDDMAVPPLKEIKNNEKNLLEKMKCELPASNLPRWSGIVNPSLYGIDTHADFLNHRQRMLLLYLIEELGIEYDALLIKYGENVSKYVISLLSSFIDQLIDWNCRLSMWIPQNEQVGRSFCGPGVAMLWDYAETDPLLKGPSNLWSKLERIIAGAKSITNKTDDNDVHIGLAKAQKLPFKSSFFDAIVTDPPYYDNIFYSALADFFYAWKRLLLKKIEPELFKKSITDNNDELVASSFRSENSKIAHEKYCHELKKAINEAARVLKKDGILSFVYSHSSINGWLALIEAFRNSPFKIISVQPLNIERKQRPRAVSSDAINTCITFIGRKIRRAKNDIDIKDLKKEIDNIIKTFSLPLIKKNNWSENDVALATFANAVGMISNANKINGVESDTDAIKILADDIKRYFPSFNVKLRNSL